MGTEADAVCLLVKFAYPEYVTGDQVSGEILLHVPATLKRVGGVRLRVWCSEYCAWIERGTRPDAKTVPAPKISSKASSYVEYYGARVTYDETCEAYTAEGGKLDAGTYIIPFTYFLPFKAPATTTAGGNGFRVVVKHYAMAQLVSDLEPKLGTEARPADEPRLLQLLDLPRLSECQPNVLASAYEQLNVVEKLSHQASLRPYTYQCSYTIPHMLLGTGELKVNVKRVTDPIVAGEVFPLTLDISNGTMTKLVGLIVSLRHIVTVHSHTGTYKQIAYTRAKWYRRVALSGHYKKPHLGQVSIPIRIPYMTPPTSHGTALTSEFELGVACRYSGRLTLTKNTTGEDVAIPIVIWPPHVHPARRGNLATWASLRDSVHPAEPIGELPEPSTNLVPPEEVTLIDICGIKGRVSELPAVTIEIEGTKPGPSSVVRLVRVPEEDQVTEGSTEAQAALRASDFKTRTDLGMWPSVGLVKLLAAAGVQRARRRERRRPTPKRIRRTVAPLRKTY